MKGFIEQRQNEVRTKSRTETKQQADREAASLSRMGLLSSSLSSSPEPTAALAGALAAGEMNSNHTNNRCGHYPFHLYIHPC